MVGIQRKGEPVPGEDLFGGPRFAGQINPDPERFVLRITMLSELAAPCTGSERRALYWPSCEPHKYQAESPTSRMREVLGPGPLVSMNGFMFYSHVAMLDISFDGRFRIAELDAGASYLSEGTCRRS
jgi:hypothetical protein